MAGVAKPLKKRICVSVVLHPRVATERCPLMPHVSISSYSTAAGTPFTVTITGNNSMLHPTLVWLTKSDFMFMAGNMALPDSTGKWSAEFTSVPAGEYVYYAQCGQDDDATGNQGGGVPKRTIVPGDIEKIL